jgi:hypothetical protein
LIFMLAMTPSGVLAGPAQMSRVTRGAAYGVPNSCGSGQRNGAEETFTATPASTASPVSSPTVTATIAPNLSCTGDCTGDGFVRVNELVLAVNIALERTALDQCPPGDKDSNGRISIDELVTSVNHALKGCR